MIRVVSVLDDVCISSSAQCCCVDGELDSGLYSTRSRSSILRQITKPCSKNRPRSQHPVCARCLWGQCGDAHASSGMFWTYFSYSSTWVITGLFLRIFERFRPVFMIFFLEFGGPYLSTLNPCPWTCCTLYDSHLTLSSPVAMVRLPKPFPDGSSHHESPGRHGHIQPQPAASGQSHLTCAVWVQSPVSSRPEPAAHLWERATSGAQWEW